MRVLPSGDTALLVELGGLDDALAFYQAWLDDPPCEIVDVIPSSRTVLVVTDPKRTDLATLRRAIRATDLRHRRAPQAAVVEVPIRYDGPDLDEVARIMHCDRSEVIARHTGAEWRAAFSGFAPGFAYLTCRDVSWNVPRRDTPRTRVPAGSVGLAGEFSGIYPRASPGGWQLIGNTAITLFDPENDPPALLSPGTRVRFTEVIT